MTEGPSVATPAAPRASRPRPGVRPGSCRPVRVILPASPAATIARWKTPVLVLVGVVQAVGGIWSIRLVLVCAGAGAAWLVADAFGASAGTAALVAAASGLLALLVGVLAARVLFFVVGLVVGAVVGARLFAVLDTGDASVLLAVVFVPAVAVVGGVRWLGAVGQLGDCHRRVCPRPCRPGSRRLRRPGQRRFWGLRRAGDLRRGLGRTGGPGPRSARRESVGPAAGRRDPRRFHGRRTAPMRHTQARPRATARRGSGRWSSWSSFSSVGGWPPRS